MPSHLLNFFNTNCFMKNKGLFLACLLIVSSFSVSAQGIYQLWGMTSAGGEDNLGTIFSMDSKATSLSVRHSFKSTIPGAGPAGGLTAYAGKLYGVTSREGWNGGIIFEWDPLTNLYKKVFDLKGFSSSGLALCDGVFYGTTAQNTLFSWHPETKVYTTLMALGGSLGESPVGKLVANEGKLYGVTNAGGTGSAGVLFEWNPTTSTYTKLHDFSSESGAYPKGNLTVYDGSIYGVTGQGGLYAGGVLYKWNVSNNTFQKKFDFSVTNGTSPSALVVKDENFYGTTASGGANGIGVIFEWNPSSEVFLKRVDFTNLTGGEPIQSMELVNGTFYGVTSNRGSNGLGAIFSWNPESNLLAKKFDFSVHSGGSSSGNLTWMDGELYGMTSNGGVYNRGALFEYDPSADLYSKRLDLGGSEGGTPYGSLSYYSGKLYGVTTVGGNGDNGVIFEWDPANRIFAKKYDFSQGEASYALGNLSLKSGRFYGMSTLGGVNGLGVIFEWDPLTNQYANRHSFSTAGGANPFGSLFLKDEKFYGVTSIGGVNSSGVLFEWDPATGSYGKKLDFSTVGYPKGTLELNDGNFYGVGGENDPRIFTWSPTSNLFSIKHVFTEYMFSWEHYNRGKPTALAGKIFGLMANGGPGGFGFIYQLDPVTNTYTNLMNFTSLSGGIPYGSLTVFNDKLYGTTSDGGNSQGAGTVFEIGPLTKAFRKIADLNGTLGARPQGDLTVTPAPVAHGDPGNCVSFTPVTINPSNNNQWIAITDANGDAVAEIKANGNNLGLVSAYAYIHNGSPRENSAYKMFLDRNLTIHVENEELLPDTRIEVRLYVRGSEYNALAMATNSQSELSGITTISDISIFKSENDECSADLEGTLAAVTTSAEAWGQDYVFTTSVSSFSTFYFGAKENTNPLPVQLTRFSGTRREGAVQLHWQTSEEKDFSHFTVERSMNGKMFEGIGKVKGVKAGMQPLYEFYDVQTGDGRRLYYRLMMTDLDGSCSYSRIISVEAGEQLLSAVYPNPVRTDLYVAPQSGRKWHITDLSGRKIKAGRLQKADSPIGVSQLAPGVYLLQLESDGVHKTFRFVKE